MKKTLLFIVAFALCSNLRAADILTFNQPDYIVVHTNLVLNNTVANTSTTNPASTSVTNIIILSTPATIYHTFQGFLTFNGTNAASITVDRTLDNSNWITWWKTNYFVPNTPGTSTSSNLELQSTGAWLAHRFTFVQITTNLATNNVVFNEMGH